MKTTTLTTCQNSQEAALIKGNLENEGIPCMLTNENFTTMMPHYNRMLGSGIQVVVFEKDIEKAAKLIFPDTTANVKCPFCESTNIGFGLGKKKGSKLVSILNSLIAWIPFNNIGNTYYCKDCKSDFKV